MIKTITKDILNSIQKVKFGKPPYIIKIYLSESEYTQVMDGVKPPQLYGIPVEKSDSTKLLLSDGTWKHLS